MRQVLLVTGGSRGIGAATARLAAERGWSVGIVYRDRDADAAAVVAAIEAAGARALAIKADLADEASIAQAFRLADQLGTLRSLVNNAGITGGVSRVADLRGEALAAALRINVWAPFICAREAILRMSTRHGGSGGSIVNVSSGASQQGSPGVWVHYAATKGALDTMTIGLAKEVAGEGIRVNGVRPGIVNTEIHADRPLASSMKWPAPYRWVASGRRMRSHTPSSGWQATRSHLMSPAHWLTPAAGVSPFQAFSLPDLRLA